MIVALFEGLTIFLSSTAFFFLGWLFFANKLFQDYEIRNRIVQLTFAATFSLCCCLFELIIFEIVDVLDKKFVLLLKKLIV
jgi:hypothetical protein